MNDSKSQGMRLGVLDFCNVAAGQTPRDALMQTVELARSVESFGYSRYWLAEHHSPDAAHSTPEVLTAVLAGVTRGLRVGPAGVLLHFASPFKVAEQFRLIETLYPGRIDLGVARGFADELTAAALLDGRDPRQALPRYGEKVGELLAFLHDTGPVIAGPVASPPQVWVMASGGQSVTLAAERGTALSLSLFLRDTKATPAAVDEYGSAFRPGHLEQPLWNVAVAGVCAPTRAEAQRIASEHDNAFVVPTVVGSPADCRDMLDDLCAAYGTGEVIFLDVATTIEDRTRSHRLLAEACLGA